MKELLFDKPSTSFNEAVPLGNGFLGAMIHGRIQKELIELNEDSLWSGGPVERYNPSSIHYIDKIRKLLMEGNVAEAQRWTERSFFPLTPHSKHYQPLGQVWLQFSDDEDVKNYERKLDMEKALCEVKYQTENNAYRRESFVSYPDQVVVYHIESDENKKLSFDLHVTRRNTTSGKTVSYLDQVDYRDGVLYLSGYNGNKETGIDYTMAVCVKIEDGTLQHYGTRIVIEDCTTATVYITGRTSYRSDDPSAWCKSQVNRVLEKDYKEIKESHEKDFQSYFQKMSLTLKKGNPTLKKTVEALLKEAREGILPPELIEGYFNFGRYLMISSSRKGSLPANLQGIWSNEFDPSWGSKYTININLEMNYWLCEKTGLSDLHLPVMELMKTMLPRGQEIAREVYGADGACAHHVTDMWGDCAPMDYNIAATPWPFGFVWLCLHILEHFQYTRDIEFLKTYYPILEENVKFLLDYLFIDHNGNYATGPSVSPENVYITSKGEKASVCMSPATDIQIIREFFIGYLEICEVLQDNRYVQAIKDRLDLLPIDKIGKYGQLMEWQEDYDEEEPGHRHIAHLFALHPGSQINVYDTPELAEASKVTLQRRLQHGGGHTGWSCAWILHFYARLQEAEKGYAVLKKLFTESTLDNLLDNCPPFQIDGNFGAADAILEFMVQDYGRRVSVLPALPEELQEGSIECLRLKCGAELSFSWEEGKVSELKLKALRDVDVLLHVNGSELNIQVKEKEIYHYKEGIYES